MTAGRWSLIVSALFWAAIGVGYGLRCGWAGSVIFFAWTGLFGFLAWWGWRTEG